MPKKDIESLRDSTASRVFPVAVRRLVAPAQAVQGFVDGMVSKAS